MPLRMKICIHQRSGKTSRCSWGMVLRHCVAGFPFQTVPFRPMKPADLRWSGGSSIHNRAAEKVPELFEALHCPLQADETIPRRL